MLVGTFVHPYTKVPLQKDEDSNLFWYEDGERRFFMSQDGLYDFVGQGSVASERDHYDHYYAACSLPSKNTDFSATWFDPRRPQNSLLLASLTESGGLAGKSILLLGNGTSAKELLFARLGAKIVYTDLSLRAVEWMRERYRTKGLGCFDNEQEVEFHAVDAVHMPFPDGLFDIVYGYEFVHHIADLERFFLEIHRVLKSDGICRFLDDAYSPVWQFLKRSILRPLQAYSHRNTGISGEDLRATQRGGFKEGELLQIMRRVGFREMFFRRESLFVQLWGRAADKVLGRSSRLVATGWPVMIGLDRVIEEKAPSLRHGFLKLIWGFNK